MFNFFQSNHLSQDKAYEQLQNDPIIKLIDVRTKEEFKDENSRSISSNKIYLKIFALLFFDNSVNSGETELLWFDINLLRIS